jgi:hypothetical protein
LSTWGEPVCFSSRGEISEGIRWNAESLSDGMQEVGDGYSSENDKDNITLSMQRAISLKKCISTREDRRMIASKATTHPFKWVRISRNAIYSQANLSDSNKIGYGMPEKELQGESRSWENCIPGLVGG